MASEIIQSTLFQIFFFSILGVSAEVLFTGVTNGFRDKDWRFLGYANVWSFLTYGIGVCLVGKYIKELQFLHWFWRSLIYVAIIYIFEYGSNYTIHSITGQYPWKYYGPLQLHHRVNFTFFPLWFALAMIFEYFYLVFNSGS